LISLLGRGGASASRSLSSRLTTGAAEAVAEVGLNISLSRSTLCAALTGTFTVEGREGGGGAWRFVLGRTGGLGGTFLPSYDLGG